MLSQSTVNCGHDRRYASVLGVAMTIAISGCVGTVPYKEPASGPTATIEFVDESTQKMSIHFFGGAKECTGRTTLTFTEPKTHRIVTIPAGRELVFGTGMDANGAAMGLLAFGAVGGLMAAATSNPTCTPAIDFVPEVGGAYMFRMNTDGSTCSFKFHLKPVSTQNPDEAPPVAFEMRQWHRAMVESGPWCKGK